MPFSASEGRGAPSVPAGLQLGRLGRKLRVKLKCGEGRRGGGKREMMKWYKEKKLSVLEVLHLEYNWSGVQQSSLWKMFEEQM